MRRKPSRCRMVIRGRKGAFLYLVFGLAVIVVMYYAWSSFRGSETKAPYSSEDDLPSAYEGQWEKDHQDAAIKEQPPLGLNNEIQMQMDNEQWRKNKALQDRLDEERIAREMALDKPTQNSGGSKDKKASPWKLGQELGSLEAALYHPAEAGDMRYFSKLERIVHLDLKGAPPAPAYLIKLFPLLKTLGATGLLVEYEDMFPYSGNISVIAAANAYTHHNLQRILAAAKENGLQVIPLVQMFGHMEFVLKFERFRHLRYSEYTPEVITPALQQSYQLLYEILEQVIAAHPDSTKIHLGCDEVWEIGKGNRQQMVAGHKLTSGELFLQHVIKVATYVKKTYPSLQPLIWDDMLRSIPYETLASSRIREVIEPVVWYYRHNILDSIKPDVWDIYGRLFPGVWVASAFKGATGSSQILTNASFHLDNNLQWVAVLRSLGRVGNKVNFRGTMLTGWQRYDHFSVLCELLPVGLPSLALNLQLLRVGGFSPREITIASRALNCSGSSTFDLEYPAITNDEVVVLQNCKFEGYQVYYEAQKVWGILEVYQRDRYLQDIITGWLTPYHIQLDISNPGRMKPLMHKLHKILYKLRALVEPMQDALWYVYDQTTVDEWISTNIKSHFQKIRELHNKTSQLLKRKSWPARPFPPATAEQPQADPRQEQPMARQEQPPARQEQPQARQEQPQARQEQPQARQEQPQARQEQPQARQEQPQARQERPSIRQSGSVPESIVSQQQKYSAQDSKQSLADAPQSLPSAWRNLPFAPESSLRGQQRYGGRLGQSPLGPGRDSGFAAGSRGLEIATAQGVLPPNKRQNGNSPEHAGSMDARMVMPGDSQVQGRWQPQAQNNFDDLAHRGGALSQALFSGPPAGPAKVPYGLSRSTPLSGQTYQRATVIPQRPALKPDLSSGQNLREQGSDAHISNREHVPGKAGLAQAADKPGGRVSKEQQQERDTLGSPQKPGTVIEGQQQWQASLGPPQKSESLGQGELNGRGDKAGLGDNGPQEATHSAPKEGEDELLSLKKEQDNGAEETKDEYDEKQEAQENEKLRVGDQGDQKETF